MKYDLEERTTRFSETIITLLKKIKLTPLNSRIVSQLVGSSGSVGANYCEANGSESKKDFVHKIRIAFKEIKETQHWLKLLSVAQPELKNELLKSYQESAELYLIFSKIITTCKSNNGDS